MRSISATPRMQWLLAGSLVLICILFMQGKAAAFSNTFPDQSDTEAGAVVYAVSSRTPYVQQSDSRLSVWFPTNSGTITIRNGHFCNSNAHDYIEGNSWSNFGGGSPVTRFRISYNGSSFDATGNKYAATNGTCNNNIVFNVSNISNMENGYYRVNLNVDYVSGTNGGMNYFNVVASGGAYVGLRGYSDTTAGHGTTQEQVDTSPGYTTYKNFFGTPCDLTSNQTATVSLYDIDNAGGSGAQPANGPPVKIRIRNLTTDSWVNFAGSVGTTWTPPDTQNSTQSITFTAQPQHKYRMDIQDVYWNNTIQYSSPYSQIYRLQCPKQANLSPRSAVTVGGSNVKGSTILWTAGTNVVFENWVQSHDVNSVVANTDNFRMNVTSSGMGGAGAWGSTQDHAIPPARQPIPNNGSRLHTYTMPASFTGYQTICRNTVISNTGTPNWVTFPNGMSNAGCVTIANPTCGTVTTNPSVPEVADNVQVTANVGGLPSGSGTFNIRIFDPSGAQVVNYTGSNTLSVTRTVNNVVGGEYSVQWTYASSLVTLNCSGTFKVIQKPFVVVRNGDVNATLDIDQYLNSSGANCQTSGGHVTGFTRGTDRGAGTELATYAGGDITDFLSAALRAAVPARPKGLAFANTDASRPHGGGFDAVVGCAEYDEDWQRAASEPAGNSTVSGYSAGTVYVNGDVYINANIEFPTSFDVDTIPSFKVVATGNIYVGSGVGRIDGAYMAKGTIYTCTSSASAPSATNLADGTIWTDCNNTLEVNGSLIAPNIRFLRMAGSTNTNNPAETITYNPAVWLQLLGGGGSSPNFEFDAYTTLPPVL